MIPAVVTWVAWVQLHQNLASDIVSTYHSSYIRYQLLNVTLQNFPTFLWTNIDHLLSGLGGMILPMAGETQLGKTLAQSLAVALIVGIVRLGRQIRFTAYVSFAAAYSLMLVVWHFPPNQRFVYPLFPLMLAGLASEGRHMLTLLRGAFRHPDRSQRIAAVGLSLASASIAILSVGLHLTAMLRYYPAMMQEHQRRTEENRTAYRWISTHLPTQSRVLAYNDATLFLYADHRACSLTILPVFWYQNDHAAVLRSYRSVDQFARQYGLRYALVTPTDGHRDLVDSDRAAAQSILSTHPAMHLMRRFGGTALYRIVW